MPSKAADDLKARIVAVAAKAARARKRAAARIKNRKPAEYEKALVTFIDVLGFKEIVKTRSAQQVRDILEALGRFTTSGEKPPPQTSTGQRLYSHPYSQSVSDAIVRVRPYETAFNDGALAHELMDLAHAQAYLLDYGVFIRAGMAIGNIYFASKKGEVVFGPAMIKAYELESQKAKFPRIFISEDILTEHATNRRLHFRDNTPTYERNFIDRMVSTDSKGGLYLDYLRFLEGEFDPPISYLFFLQKHAKQISDALTTHSAKRVRSKYLWLAKYHNSVVAEIRSRVMATDEDRNSFLLEAGIKPKAFFATLRVKF